MTATELAAPARRASLASIVVAHRWVLLLSTAMVGWWAGLFAVMHSDYVNFRLARLDLGNMVQAVWSTAHGRPLEVTAVTGEQVVRIGHHVDPFLALLAPFWVLAPTPLTLPALQLAAVALGALPVFWLARRHLGSENAAGLLAISYLAYPWLAWNAIEQVHPVTFAIPLFLYAIWFLDTERYWAFGICAALAVSTGELMGVTLAALGIWYAFARMPRVGVAIAAAGVGWSLVALYVIVPAFSGGESVFYGYYESVGGSPAGIARTAVTDPGTIVSALTTTDDVRYVFALALPLAGMFLLAPGLAAVTLPQLLINGLSDSPVTVSYAHHYTSAIIPFLVAGTIFGLARLSPERRRLVLVYIPSVCIGLSLLFPAWPVPTGWRLWEANVPPAKVEALRAAVAHVPDDAPVSSTNKVGSHFAARHYAFTIPTVGRAEWIVLDSADTWIPWIVAGRDQPLLLRDFLRRIQTDPGWEKRFEQNGVFVFQRTTADDA